MADFITAFNKTMEHEASGKSYDNSSGDKGNFWNGQLIGTKFGVTGTFYFEVFRKPPTASIIKNLTLSQAADMAYTFIWKRMNVGQIKDQDVANFVFDYCYNRYGEAIRIITAEVMKRPQDVKASLNTLRFTPGTIAEINNSDPFAFIETLKDARTKKALATYKGDTLRVIKTRIDSFTIAPTSPVMCNVGRLGKVVTTQSLCAAQQPTTATNYLPWLLGGLLFIYLIRR